MSSYYFSCPKFTVRLVVSGTIIQEAAPIVKKFEGQTLGALASWAESKFGGPVIVEELPAVACPDRAPRWGKRASRSRHSGR
jgi:hypothetical protein